MFTQTRLAFTALLLSIGIPNLPCDVAATPSSTEDGLDLVVDLETGERFVPSLAPGETFRVHAVVRDLTAPSLLAYQIGLAYDPSLAPTGVELRPDVGVAFQPTPTDVYVGLDWMIYEEQGPHVLATWTFVRLGGFEADHPATVRLRALENGEASHYTTEAPAYHHSEFRDTGPVVVGTPGERVLRFQTAPRDFVRERSYGVEWETVGLQDLRLDGQPVSESGSITRVADVSSEHILSWTASDGPHRLVAPVDVLVEPVIENFRADPPSTLPETFAVHWTVRGADVVWWEPGTELVSSRGTRGVKTVEPRVITLRAENEWGIAQQSIVLNGLGEPHVAGLWAEPDRIDAGDQSRLSWSVVDAERVVLEPFGIEVPANGSRLVTPDSTTTYHIRAQGAGLSAEDSVTVDVNRLRIARFTRNPGEIYPGEATTLAWSIVNAEEAWIEPDVGPVDPVVGSVTVTPTRASTVYTLRARGNGIEATTGRTVVWKKPDAQLWNLSWMALDTIFIQSQVDHADSAIVLPDVGWLDPPNGTGVHPFPGSEPEVFTLQAFNGAGKTVAVYRYEPFAPYLSFHPESEYAPHMELGRRIEARVHINRATHYRIWGEGVLSEPIDQHVPQGLHDGGFSFSFWLDQPIVLHAYGSNAAYSLEDSIGFGTLSTHFLEADVDDPVLEHGGTTTLRWRRTDNSTSGRVWIEPLDIHEYVPGSMEIQPEETTQYVVNYRNDASRPWTHRRLVTVQVYDGETSLVAEPMRPLLGGTFRLHATMPTDALEARLSPGIGDIEPHDQVFELATGSAEEYALEVTTPRGRESARVRVHPEGVTVVPTLVRRLDFSGVPVQGRVRLSWSVETIRPNAVLQVLRAHGEEELRPWRTLSSTHGDMVDGDVQADLDYRYLLRVTVEDQIAESDVVVVRPGRALRTRLLPNVPNPFNPSTEIRWELGTAGDCRLDIHDLRGRRVRSVRLGWNEVGPHEWVWDGRDQDGSEVAGGAYIVRLQGPRRVVARKIVLTK